MNKNLLYVVVAVVVLIGFFLYSANKQGTTPTPDDAIPVSEESNAPNQSAVTLSQQNESGETGAATLVEENGQVVVTLSMLGFPQDTPQPAHIHVGVCPDVGAVMYPLTNVVNGESTTTLEVTLAQLESELPLGINVHKSAAEASVYTACGDLQF